MNHFNHAMDGQISARRVGCQPVPDSLRGVGITKGSHGVIWIDISQTPEKKISIKTGTSRPSNEPVCAIPREWAYAMASRTSLNMRFTVGKAKYP